MKKVASQNKQARKTRRQERIRASLSGTAERPRLTVFKSNTTVYAQLIDDTKGNTIASASSGELKSKVKGLALGTELGKTIAKKAVEKNIKKIVFDRSGYIYTGKIKAIADGAREGGLEF